ncbi:heavy metal translocating P-type ATPase [Anopheles sinensis]|uniref:Heavy metal translocating P-type ATPase n=1 Tax=Anopheles sinensis TaxID=74873 RepID=A0A084W4L8_ANOSI|nr:heavy metal translocating P-type ATPase [Anopheles sinensis]
MCLEQLGAVSGGKTVLCLVAVPKEGGRRKIVVRPERKVTECETIPRESRELAHRPRSAKKALRMLQESPQQHPPAHSDTKEMAFATAKMYKK